MYTLEDSFRSNGNNFYGNNFLRVLASKKVLNYFACLILLCNNYSWKRKIFQISLNLFHKIQNKISLQIFREQLRSDRNRYSLSIISNAGGQEIDDLQINNIPLSVNICSIEELTLNFLKFGSKI